jgi:hypothetical protein
LFCQGAGGFVRGGEVSLPSVSHAGFIKCSSFSKGCSIGRMFQKILITEIGG